MSPQGYYMALLLTVIAFAFVLIIVGGYVP